MCKNPEKTVSHNSIVVNVFPFLNDKMRHPNVFPFLNDKMRHPDSIIQKPLDIYENIKGAHEIGGGGNSRLFIRGFIQHYAICYYLIIIVYDMNSIYFNFYT